MLYLIAILLPPVAVLMCGKPGQAILNLVLTLCCLWIGGIIHAVMVVSEHNSEKRFDRLGRSLRR